MKLANKARVLLSQKSNLKNVQKLNWKMLILMRKGSEIRVLVNHGLFRKTNGSSKMITIVSQTFTEVYRTWLDILTHFCRLTSLTFCFTFKKAYAYWVNAERCTTLPFYVCHLHAGFAALGYAYKRRMWLGPWTRCLHGNWFSSGIYIV